MTGLSRCTSPPSSSEATRGGTCSAARIDASRRPRSDGGMPNSTMPPTPFCAQVRALDSCAMSTPARTSCSASRCADQVPGAEGVDQLVAVAGVAVPTDRAAARTDSTLAAATRRAGFIEPPPVFPRWTPSGGLSLSARIRTGHVVDRLAPEDGELLRLRGRRVEHLAVGRVDLARDEWRHRVEENTDLLRADTATEPLRQSAVGVASPSGDLAPYGVQGGARRLQPHHRRPDV